jgi:hypothetical protein
VNPNDWKGMRAVGTGGKLDDDAIEEVMDDRDDDM